MKPWETPPSGAAATLVRSIAATIPQLTTARLILRAPRMTDFDAFTEILTGPRAAHIGGALSRASAMEVFLASAGGWQLRGHGLWSVDRSSDASLIGFILLQHETGDPEAELGYLFAEAGEGQGFATEAAAAARDFARDVLRWSTVVSYIDPANARSLRVAEKLGAVQDAAMVDGCLVLRHDLSTANPIRRPR
jgi:RimJ/RimL family protein N-acetyltransferase